MRIALITPSTAGARTGNRTTAARWARILRGLGHRVRVSREYLGERADLMVALHAWRSADAIARFANECPERPLVVALTGTDIYQFIHSHPAATLRSLEAADMLIGLHDLVDEAIPAEHRGKLRVIHQSAPPGLPRRPLQRSFSVCVAGNLREEKDPLRAALAVRDLPANSRIRVEHFGAAQSPDWVEAARAEMRSNPRYRWHDAVSGYRLRQAYARSRLLVLSSRMEGGANVVGEAVMAGLPLVSSRIHGSIGLLGEDYPGYFPVGDTAALRTLLLCLEHEPERHAELEARCAALRPLFESEREIRNWAELLRQVGC